MSPTCDDIYMILVPCSLFLPRLPSLEAKLLFGSLMNSEKDQHIHSFTHSFRSIRDVQLYNIFACMPLLPFAALKKSRVVGNHHNQSTLEKIFWPLPGSLSSSVSQFGSQNWIVRVGKYLWVSFFLLDGCAHKGQRDFWIFGKLGLQFWLQLQAKQKPSSCPFLYIFSSNSSWVIYHKPCLHSFIIVYLVGLLYV